MILTVLYDLALILISLLTLPKLLYLWLVRKKYRTSFLQRFGKGFPTLEKNGGQVVWIHAVSVGETRAIAPLAKLIKERIPNVCLLVTSVTETGHAEAKRSLSFADAHAYMPLDFGWIIGPIVRRIKPDLVILCESDFWLNFLAAVKKEGGACVLVNGKLSEKSMHRFSSASFFTRRLFGLLDLLCVQNRHYAERFEKIGIHPSKIRVTGNIKFDDNYPKLSAEEQQTWRSQLGTLPTDLVLVVGSCHDPEEKLILQALRPLWSRFSNLKVLVVPRHPERFNEVAALLQKEGIPFHRFSQTGSDKEASKVILIDTMGLLRKCYQIASLALVAGSYTAKVGGHNIMEPSWYGVPVLFGPEMHSQPELVELVKEYHSGLQVYPEDLQSTLEDLFTNSDKRQKLGQAGLTLVADMQGATERTWTEIQRAKIFPHLR